METQAQVHVGNELSEAQLPLKQLTRAYTLYPWTMPSAPEAHSCAVAGSEIQWHVLVICYSHRLI